MPYPSVKLANQTVRGTRSSEVDRIRMETPPLAEKGPRENGPTPSGVSPSSTNRQTLGRKFMQTLDDQVYRNLLRFAQERGVTIQGLIRAVIVPEWITSQDIEKYNPSQPAPSLADSRVRSGDLAPAARNLLLVQR